MPGTLEEKISDWTFHQKFLKSYGYINGDIKKDIYYWAVHCIEYRYMSKLGILRYTHIPIKYIIYSIYESTNRKCTN